LVDDSLLVQKLITALFAQSNELELIIASSYEEAKVVIKSGEEFFASIVCIVLPDALNGEMVDLSLDSKIPTLVLTSSLNKSVRHQMSKKPIIDYVSKNTQNDISYAVELIHTLLYFEDKKVLVVTESSAERTLLSLFFKHLLLNPIHTPNVESAIEILKKDKSIDIIATDYKMSGMNGLQLVQSIRNRYTRDQKMIFALVASKENDVLPLFLKYGANEIIVKPYTKEEFNARIFKELDFKKKIDEVKRINKTIESYVITSTTDENGIIKQVSDAFSDVSGYTKKELIGQPQNVVRHPDMPSEVFEDLWTTIKSGKKWNGTVKNRKKDGGYYWVNAHIEPVLNSKGKITGYQAIRQDITAEKEVEEKSKLLSEAKQKITDSIKFSSLIQDALLPKSEIIGEYFNDFFVLWEPKDIVGGDIYQFIEREDDCLVFVIDCTGHGVPGAFMTMVTKTVIQAIVNENNFNNPALIMQELSKNIKTTLKQDNPNSKSDAGLDGGILYFNKKENRAIYSGAKTPLFYIQNEELNVFKSDRQSVGYKKSDTDFEFSNFELEIKEDTYFYITTDGFIDQNGGDEGYPLGKKKLQKLILENYKRSFTEQKDIFHNYLLNYQGKHERDDDVTFLGFNINYSSPIQVETFFSFKGFLTQSLLGDIEQSLEQDYQNIFEHSRKKEKLFTILYELGQNIIKYAPQDEHDDESIQSCIEMAYDMESDKFSITSKNKVFVDSIEKIKSRINEANEIDKDQIKDMYRELRKSKKYGHEDGAGLGFFELAKRSSEKIEYSFNKLDENSSYFKITVLI